MIRIIQLLLIVIAMHFVGSSILLGCVSGSVEIAKVPWLALLGFYFILPEAVGVSIQWSLYDPYPKPTFWKFVRYALVFSITGGIISAPFIPKVSGKEGVFWIAGSLAGFGAALFSFVCIHMIKSNEIKQADPQR